VTSFIDYGASAQDLLQPVLKVKASQPTSWFRSVFPCRCTGLEGL